MSTRDEVLFVSHEGSLTGAPMALLHLVRWLRDNSNVEPRMAILRDGPLTVEFEQVGETTVLGTDDILSAPPERAATRRGVAGLIFAYKTAGAAADRGDDLDAWLEESWMLKRTFRNCAMIAVRCLRS